MSKVAIIFWNICPDLTTFGGISGHRRIRALSKNTESEDEISVGKKKRHFIYSMVLEQWEAHFAVLSHYTRSNLINTMIRFLPLHGLLRSLEKQKRAKMASSLKNLQSTLAPKFSCLLGFLSSTEEEEICYAPKI